MKMRESFSCEAYDVVVHEMRDHAYVFLALKESPNLGTQHIYIINNGWVELTVGGESLTVPPESGLKTAIEVWAKSWLTQMTLQAFIQGLDI